MFYFIENGKLHRASEFDYGNDERDYIGVVTYDRILSAAKDLGIKNGEYAFLNNVPRFESHEGFDFICVRIMRFEDVLGDFNTVHIYFSHKLLLFIGENPSGVEKIIDSIIEDDIGDLNFGRVLCSFFDRLTEKDADALEGIEDEISELEASLITTDKRDCAQRIIYLRKRLMVLKQYYEHLLRVFEGMLENENSILDERILKVFKIISGRIDRLYHNVLNLRDYVTQVREAYQAEIDISLNRTMKIFTVVTTIFFPLTLITGWYGMNLKMPEYGWDFAYLMVAAISVLVVVVSIWFFKKNKWF
ncbi:MAG: Mg2+ transporter protein CorA family protein [Oscillospiraceae bacterium]|jgi:magnesium transporter|nr:Mg2+ transporter protein CorA family protein [Oscillospiraceae bacterium]